MNPAALKSSASAALPLSFIAAGIAALFAGMTGLVMHPEVLATYHYNQLVIALTHLFTLGWMCSVVIGALYQLAPVALETKLYSERLARWHFVLHIIGVAGMVPMFWIWNLKAAACFALMLGTGVLLFVWNIARTLARAPRRTVVAAGIASAIAWLSLGILAGLLVLASKKWLQSPFDPIRQMHAHAHLAGLGFFVILVAGVSYKLVPMFALSEIQSQKRARASLILLNAGLAGLFVTILIGSALKLAFAMVLQAGFAVFGVELIAILRARKRRALDWGLRGFLTGLALLIPLCAVSLVLSWPSLPLNAFTGQLENLYGLLALLGVITMCILGMLYKIVPFLVWYSRYSSEIGRKKVPALSDLYSVQLQRIGYWSFLGGLSLASIGTLAGHPACVQRGAIVWAFSIGVFTINMAKICAHLIRPKQETVLMNTALKGAS